MMDLELNMDEMRIVQMYSGVSRRDTVRRAMMASAYVDNDCIDRVCLIILMLMSIWRRTRDESGGTLLAQR